MKNNMKKKEDIVFKPKGTSISSEGALGLQKEINEEKQISLKSYYKRNRMLRT